MFVCIAFVSLVINSTYSKKHHFIIIVRRPPNMDDNSFKLNKARTCTTVIRLVVSVPVLSEQIVVALPIVSQASKWRTKLLSAIIF